MANNRTNEYNLSSVVPEYLEFENALKKGVSWYDIIYPQGETYSINPFSSNKRSRPNTKKFSLEKKPLKKKRSS